MSRLVTALLLALSLFAGGGVDPAQAPAEYQRARELYQRTEYQASLNLLLPLGNDGAPQFQLMGQDSFMLGDYKKATDAFDKALALLQASQKPASQELYVWLGRAYGRRAETSGLLTAPGYASRARKYF